jgi:hypothetical protein
MFLLQNSIFQKPMLFTKFQIPKTNVLYKIPNSKNQCSLQNSEFQTPMFFTKIQIPKPMFFRKFQIPKPMLFRKFQISRTNVL